MSRLPFATTGAVVAAGVCAALATPLGGGRYWAAATTSDYVTVWLNGALFLVSGFTLLASIPLVQPDGRGVVRLYALAIAGWSGVLLFVENGLEDAWHQQWVTRIHAYDVLLVLFLLGVLAGAVSVLIGPGTRRIGLGLLMVALAPVVGGSLPWGSSDSRTGLSLAVGFSILAVFEWSLERRV